MRIETNVGRRALGAAVVSISVLLYWSSTSTPAAQQAQQQASELAQYIKANYTKREVMIPMRDGVKLFTAIYSPRDASQPRIVPVTSMCVRPRWIALAFMKRPARCG